MPTCQHYRTRLRRKTIKPYLIALEILEFCSTWLIAMQLHIAYFTDRLSLVHDILVCFPFRFITHKAFMLEIFLKISP